MENDNFLFICVFLFLFLFKYIDFHLATFIRKNGNEDKSDINNLEEKKKRRNICDSLLIKTSKCRHLIIVHSLLHLAFDKEAEGCFIKHKKGSVYEICYGPHYV